VVYIVNKKFLLFNLCVDSSPILLVSVMFGIGLGI